MRALNLFGTVPWLLAENTPPWDWLGQLRLSIDPAQIRFVDLLGSGADYFDATLNRGLGTITITPFARADYEAFTRAGLAPELSFTLRFFMADGSIAQGVQDYTVTVLDVDDTPPQALRLEVGGAVPYGVAGVTVGTLVVSDPDTAAGFSFSIREDDSWLFEVSGNALRLKPGMMLAVDDGPLRAVTIDVSDGRQSSAFTVSFDLTDPRAPAGQLANVLMPGMTKAGFSWTGDGVLRGDVMSSDLRSIRDHGALLEIRLDSGEAVWVEQPRVIDLLDGRIDYAPTSRAAHIWNFFETATNREPSLKTMQFMNDWVAGGATDAQLASLVAASPELSGLSNEALVRRFFVNSVGWISEEVVASHKARLDAGLPREQLLGEFVTWRQGLGHEAARAEEGLFVPRSYAHQVDLLLEVGAGIASGPATRWWTEQIASGASSLGYLAWAVTTTPGFKQGIGAEDAWHFAYDFFLQALGVRIDVPGIVYWATNMLTGNISQSDFMTVIANASASPAFASSPVYDRPDAAAFAANWF